jgi:hypothetical protein
VSGSIDSSSGSRAISSGGIGDVIDVWRCG